jgi:alkanesulfonate monooxygenase SsuD/methylene tetrahydromethanopterin reductase-like flavin-dependent oxidoreductase (luciferase family)
MRIGIGIGDIAGAPAGIDDLVAQAKRAEADGFASGWCANIFGMDAIMAAALCGRETSRIELGTAVVPTYPRHPVAMAQQALSAQAVARGRFTLGIGLSHQVVIEGMLGLSFAKPFSHMREYLAVLGPLIRTGSVQYAGEEYRVGANVTVPGATPCPILVAALAPKMLALTGREGRRDDHVDDGAAHAPRAHRSAHHGGGRQGRPSAAAGRRRAADRGHPRNRGRARVRGARVPGLRLPALVSRMLDREHVEGPADVAIVGDESAVGTALERLAECGATDYLAVPFAVDGDAEAVERTRALLVRLARR